MEGDGSQQSLELEMVPAGVLFVPDNSYHCPDPDREKILWLRAEVSQQGLFDESR